MTNERLNAAFDRSGMKEQAVALAAEVDPKTVAKWLDGRVPHPRHRRTLSRILGEDEDYLWPATAREQLSRGRNAEIVATFPHRSNVDVSRWRSVLNGASEQIDLLGYTLYFLPQMIPELPDILSTKCQAGTRIRIVLADPECEQVALRDLEEKEPITIVARIQSSLRVFKQLASCPNAELHFQTAPLYNSIYRFDDQMFVTPHLYATPGFAAPLLHLRQVGPIGIFSTFASHFEALWSDTTPIGQDRWQEAT